MAVATTGITISTKTSLAAVSFHRDAITTLHTIPISRRASASSPLTFRCSPKSKHIAKTPTFSAQSVYYSSFYYPTLLPPFVKGYLKRLTLDASASSSSSSVQVEEQAEVEVAKGYTMTQFCDKMIEVFMKEKPQSNEWRKLLVFRDEWNKYKENFYNRCQVRADVETDPVMKQKLISLGRKVKKIDEEMEMHEELLKELHQNPTDTNAIVAKRRKDFTDNFFRYLTLIADSFDGLEDRDGMARLGAKCLSAIRAYDNAMEDVEMLEVAQSKFDDILNSPSLDAACEKIKALAKSKELDSSLILLINQAWASAKESTTMKSEVKEIMHQLYKATKKSLRSIVPEEIRLLKYLLNIIDPEERFSAMATAFSPGDEREAKDVDVLYTTPKELHKWIKIMLDAYHLNKEETDLREVKQMTQPAVIQRLFILKETIEEEYLRKRTETTEPEDSESKE